MIFEVLYNLLFNPQNAHSLEFQLWVLLSELGTFTIQLDQTLWNILCLKYPMEHTLKQLMAIDFPIS